MKKYIPILTILLMLTAIACTKYKEDSFISFRKPETRLHGYWKIVAFEVDGADSLANLYTYTTFENCNFHFYRDKGNSWNKIDGCVNEWLCPWSISDKQFSTGNYFLHPLKNNDECRTYFEILKLYKNDFWIKKEFNGKTYIIKFKKQ
jgi:hypothetical protein